MNKSHLDNTLKNFDKEVLPITWCAEDPETPIQFICMERYPLKGGGISVRFQTSKQAQTVLLLLENTGTNGEKNPFYINKYAIGRWPDRIAPDVALCISKQDARMLHLETMGETAIRKLSSACEKTVGQGLPARILSVACDQCKDRRK